MTNRYCCLLLLTIGLVSCQTAFAVETFELPADLESLLPGQAAAFVALKSVNELADQYAELLNTLEEGTDASREDVFALFDHVVPDFTEYVNLDRPLGMAVGLPNLMGGGDPPFTIIVPILEGIEEVEPLGDDAEFAVTVFAGEYLALSTDPAYEPGNITPALAAHLPAGVVSATLDLETVVLNFRPFVEMGMAGIPTRPVGVSRDSIPGFTPDEAAAMSDAISKVMDSAARLDLSLDRDGELITWHTGLGIKPGSALDPGPQPDFERALALTAALPDDHDFLQVLAMDQTRIFAHFRDYYLITMRNALGQMPDEQAARYDAWVQNYLDGMDMWSHPMAAALRVDDDGMAAQLIMEMDDPDAALAKLSEILTGMNDLGIGYTLTRRDDEKIAGVTFRAWDVDIDLAEFEAAMPQHSDGPAMSGTERMQAEQLIAVMRKIMPRVYLGAKDGKLFMASDNDSEALARTVKNGRKGGWPDKLAAQVAAQAGPHCQQVITGDLLAILRWVTELMEDLDTQQREVVSGHPIPFRATATIEGTDFGFDMGMDLPAVGDLVRAIAEMEEMSGRHEPAAGDR